MRERVAAYVSVREMSGGPAEELRAQLAALTAEWEELMAQLEGQAAG
jgi:hypothetical protein